MSFKRVMPAVFLVCLFAISAVSAADNVTCDVFCVNETIDEIAGAGDNQVVLKENNDVGTLYELDQLIEKSPEGSNLKLTKDYRYLSGQSNFGIDIEKAITIDGQGHTLDGNHGARIFNVKASDVVFKNIFFINAYQDGFYVQGGAIKGKCTAINCTFINNTVDEDCGGAMCNGNAINCTFINNYAVKGGGAIAFGNAENCIFIGNTARDEGGALYSGNAINCIFINNSAEDGGAMLFGTARNCTFDNNHAKYGGAFNNGAAYGCMFVDNSAERWGGAVRYVNVFKCTFINNSAQSGGAFAGDMGDNYANESTFINNHADSDGGAIYNGKAYNSTFIGNTAEKGGAISYSDAFNSTFKDNSANYGNAMNYGSCEYCYFGGDSKSETYKSDVSHEIIHASLELSQSGDYYLEKSLTVKLINLDTKTGVRYEDVKIKFSNGKEITLCTDSKGMVAYDVTFNPGTYSVTASVVNDNIQAGSKSINNFKIDKYPASLKLEQIGNHYQSTLIRVSLTNTKSNSGIAGKSIKLTFSNGKTADLKMDSKGIASYDVAFAPGEYKVTCKVNDLKINETAGLDFKVNKVSSTIIQTKLTTSYKSGKSFKVRLVNSQTKKPVTGVKLTLKVFTDNKFTTHQLTTDANGYVYISCDKLAVGSHKVVVTCNNGYCIGNSATSTVKITSLYPTLTTYTFKTKLGTTLTGKGVIIKDKNSKLPIKGIKVKFKLYTKDKKYRIYTLTTDSLGKCALFTNKYSLGSHKLIITIEIPKIYKKALNKKYKSIKKTTSLKILQGQKFKLMNNNKYFDIIYSNGNVRVA